MRISLGYVTMEQMERPHPTLFNLQELTVDFALVERNHYLAGSARHENDAEHTMTVALLCWAIVEQNNLNLDIAKVLKYAIVHDLPEVHAGDVNTFASPIERNEKVLRETEAKERIKQEFGGFPDLSKTIYAYDDKKDNESLFVWTVDKMQALIMGELDGWRPYAELEITFVEFCDKYEELLDKASPHCREIFETLIAYCKTTYYDRPE